MKALICPVSVEKIDNNIARLTGILTSIMIILFLITQNIWFIVILTLDFLIRSLVKVKYSPLSWISAKLVHYLSLKVKLIGKAQKIFAARIGFLFSFLSSIFYYIDPFSSFIISGILLFFALLEGVLDICVGCLIYTYLVYPFFGKDAT